MYFAILLLCDQINYKKKKHTLQHFIVVIDTCKQKTAEISILKF